MAGHTDPMEILRLNPEAIWIIANTTTKSMLCDFKKWETLPETKSGMAGDFMKRVSDWHENILGPWTLHYTMTHLPNYMKSILIVNIDKSDIFELHICLLTAVSKSLVEYIAQKGVGKKTFKEIEKWFSLMQMLEDDGSMVIQAEAETRALFLAAIKDFKHESSTPATDVSEYPFFHHQSLFIYIAHVVYLTCVTPDQYSLLDQDHPYTNLRMMIDSDSINSWEIESANVFNDHFKMGSAGLCNTENIPDPIHFFDELPYKWFSEENQKRIVPPVKDLHVYIMHKTFGRLQEIMNIGEGCHEHDHDMLDRFEDHLVETGAALEARDILLRKREKTRKSYRKTMKDSSLHKPREPCYFERDIFLFGTESYYYLMCTSKGIASRKTHKQLQSLHKQH